MTYYHDDLTKKNFNSPSIFMERFSKLKRDYSLYLENHFKLNIHSIKIIVQMNNIEFCMLKFRRLN